MSLGHLGREAIGQVGMSLLLQKLKDSEPGMRAAAIVGLAKLGEEAISNDEVTLLVQTAEKDSNSEVRMGAILALERLPIKAIGSSGIETLGRIAEKERDGEVRKAASQLHGYLVAKEEASLEGALARIGKDASVDFRRGGLKSIGETTGEAASPAQIKLLAEVAEQDSEAGVRLMAHATLCNLRVPGHLAPVLEHFRSMGGQWQMRRQAAEALGSIGSKVPCAGRGCDLPSGGVEDVTEACQVEASTRREDCRRALHGVDGTWDARATNLWLRLAVPRGMELKSLVFHTRDRYISRMRVFVGSCPSPLSMAQIADVALEKRDYVATLVSEADMQRHLRRSPSSSAGLSAAPGVSNRPQPLPQYLHIEIEAQIEGLILRVGGFQVVAAWGSAKTI